MEWRQLSVRDGEAESEVPYEGVPWHLYEPLHNWVNRVLGGAPNSYSNSRNGPRLATAIRYPMAPGQGDYLTVRNVTEALKDRPDLMLDAVDAVLYLEDVYEDYRIDLDEMLRLSGSVWQVDPGGKRLVRRLNATTTAAFAEASSPSDQASVELKEAWTAAYSRNPNPSDAWDHSIKAVEAVLIPIVTPAKDRATLGDVVGILGSQGSRWQLSLHGPENSRSVAPLVSMLRLMWPNPDRHGGDNSRQPSLEEAQAVVHLAVCVVQWAHLGGLSSRTSSRTDI